MACRLYNSIRLIIMILITVMLVTEEADIWRIWMKGE